MSCRWRLTPARRSLPPEASSRFWVFSSTPRPALEMYSSLLQSTVTVPLTPSRNDWALGDCAASRRPAITTVASAPYSIANIAPLGASRIGRIHACYPRLPEGSPALTGLLGVMVLDGIDQSADEVQAQPPGGALLGWQVDLRVRRLGRIEPVDVEVGQGRLDPAVDPGQVEADLGLAHPAVLDHIGEELLHREVDRLLQVGIDAQARESGLGELDDLA